MATPAQPPMRVAMPKVSDTPTPTASVSRRQSSDASLLESSSGASRPSGENPRRLYLASAASLVAGFLVWLLGVLLLHATGRSSSGWDAVWIVAGVSFLGTVLIPVPGITASILLSLRNHLALGLAAVTGAALGSIIGAGLLLALGSTGRAHLRRRATHSPRARRMLEWSTRFASRWTYAGIALLLIPQFIPKLVVMYAAALLELRVIPFLACTFVGVFLRNLLVLGAFSLVP